MARLNVYVPDDLAASARAAGLNVSALTQEALKQALQGIATDAWLAVLRREVASVVKVRHRDAMAALESARKEFDG